MSGSERPISLLELCDFLHGRLVQRPQRWGIFGGPSRSAEAAQGSPGLPPDVAQLLQKFPQFQGQIQQAMGGPGETKVETRKSGGMTQAGCANEPGRDWKGFPGPWVFGTAGALVWDCGGGVCSGSTKRWFNLLRIQIPGLGLNFDPCRVTRPSCMQLGKCCEGRSETQMRS